MAARTKTCWIVRVEDWDGTMIISVNSSEKRAIQAAENYLESVRNPKLCITIEEFLIDVSYSGGVKKSYLFTNTSRQDSSLDSRISIISQKPIETPTKV